jgi:hypothetical protein
MNDNIKFSNMPQNLDDELIKRRDSLIVEGKQELREILGNFDMNKAEQARRAKAVLSAKKGAYSRKFHQFAKELYIVDLFERNNVPMSFKNFNVISQKIFGESLDKSVIARMDKDLKYGKGVQSPVIIDDEVEIIKKLQFAINFMVTPYRNQVLENLAFDKIAEDYFPIEENAEAKNRRAKL